MEQKTTFYVDVLTRLRSLKHSDLKQIAVGAGVPESTVRKLFYGEVSDPRIQTVEALHNYFASHAEGDVSRNLIEQGAADA